MQKEKCIHVRIEKPIYDFLSVYSIKNKMNISDVVRNLCIFMFVAFGNTKKESLLQIFSSQSTKNKFNKFLKTATK